MLKTIHLKFGRTPASKPESIEVTPITVFVGPNNSGKSKVLQEMNVYFSNGQSYGSDLIIDSINFISMSDEEAQKKLDSYQIKPYPNENIHAGHIIVGKRGARNHIPADAFKNILKYPDGNIHALATIYLAGATIFLGGANRIGLIDAQSAGDLQSPPMNSFQTLFTDDAKRLEARRIIYDAFGSYLVIDPTALGQFRLRMSDRQPEDATEERGIDQRAVDFHSNAKLMQEFSDGVKTFTGMVVEFIAGDPEIILIDEPEAFLHPSLAYKLGNELSTSSVKFKRKLFASTHSPQFVMGCIQSGAPINIIRLTYREGIGSARILKNSDLLSLMRNPLLRSTGVLSALFYENVVITESDSDRAFYQEINERLARYSPDRAIPNCLFLNAQNKQTVHLILKPLRDLGIPAVGIVDVDILKEGGEVWSKFLAGGHIDDITKESLAVFRAKIKAAMDETKANMKRDGGVAILQDGALRAAEHLFDQLDEYGLFAVRKGELESWLKHLGVTGHGSEWLIKVFERLGEDIDSPDYVLPDKGDVWDFMARIRSWMVNPSRKGIPE